MANESMANVQTKESSTITPHQERNPPKGGRLRGDQLDTRRDPANCYSVLYRVRIQPGRTDVIFDSRVECGVIEQLIVLERLLCFIGSEKAKVLAV